jgi:hypothetical protein
MVKYEREYSEDTEARRRFIFHGGTFPIEKRILLKWKCDKCGTITEEPESKITRDYDGNRMPWMGWLCSCLGHKYLLEE